MSTLPISEQARRSRRLAWLALWFGVASFIVVAISQLYWARTTSWTSWVLPILLIGNASVLLLPPESRNATAVKVYWGISMGVAILIIIDLVTRMWRR